MLSPQPSWPYDFDKIRERLAWADDPDPLEGTKPNGMHWRTFHRLVGELEELEYPSNLGRVSFINQKFDRDGLLEPGRRFGWQWSTDGEQVASIQAQVGHGQVRLIYRSQDYGDDWESHDYPVPLRLQPCHFGGYRQWFVCPAQGCGRRVAKLYSGRIFACRHCYQLAYTSQREAAFQRAERRADKIRERLGWADDEQEYVKPKGMHWQTYHRLVDELEAWQHRSDVGMMEYTIKLLGGWTRFEA